MSTSTITLLSNASRQVTIYMGIPILITGIIGGICNTIVFLSLKTFRQSSCAFYLTIMSIVNIGHLITGLLSRIMISGFNMDWTQTSLFYCKFRAYSVQLCVGISFTCMCLATIDQYLATCSQPRWQQWSNIRVAHRLTISFIIIWLLHGTPYAIYYNHIKSTPTSKNQCVITNDIFQIYVYSIQTLVLYGLLPIFLNTLFGLLAYRNIRDLTYRTIPLVRRELDKQMTVIVLIQTVYNFIATTPNVIINIFTLINIVTKNSSSSGKIELASTTTLCIFYLNFAIPFYMYLCASGRFRHQFIYVFYRIHFNRCRRRLTIPNQVIPQ